MAFDHFYASLAAAHADDDDDVGASGSGLFTPPAGPTSRRRAGPALGVPHRGRLHFPVEQLQRVYHLPLREAATELGICEAALKRICRRNHIMRWPFRQLQSVTRRIEEETRLVAMHRAFRNSIIPTDDSAESDRFLLPHELEDRRIASAMDAQLERQQNEHALRLERLKREEQAIIESAHVDVARPRAHSRDDDDVANKEEPDDDAPSSDVMLEAISVDDPLDMLASLCTSELSRKAGKELLTPRSAVIEEGAIHSVEMLSCAMTETVDEA